MFFFIFLQNEAEVRLMGLGRLCNKAWLTQELAMKLLTHPKKKKPNSIICQAFRIKIYLTSLVVHPFKDVGILDYPICGFIFATF